MYHCIFFNLFGIVIVVVVIVVFVVVVVFVIIFIVIGCQQTTVWLLSRENNICISPYLNPFYLFDLLIVVLYLELELLVQSVYYC